MNARMEGQLFYSEPSWREEQMNLKYATDRGSPLGSVPALPPGCFAQGMCAVLADWQQAHLCWEAIVAWNSKGWFILQAGAWWLWALEGWGGEGGVIWVPDECSWLLGRGVWWQAGLETGDIEPQGQGAKMHQKQAGHGGGRARPCAGDALRFGEQEQLLPPPAHVCACTQTQNHTQPVRAWEDIDSYRRRQDFSNRHAFPAGCSVCVSGCMCFCNGLCVLVCALLYDTRCVIMPICVCLFMKLCMCQWGVMCVCMCVHQPLVKLCDAVYVCVHSLFCFSACVCRMLCACDCVALSIYLCASL